MDDTARQTVKSQAIKARYIMKINTSKLSYKQLKVLERSIEDYRELVEDCRLKNVFSNIYRQYDKESTSEVFCDV